MRVSTTIALSLLGLANAAAPPPVEKPVVPFKPAACPADSPRGAVADHWHFIYTRSPLAKPQCHAVRAEPAKELIASWVRDTCNAPCAKAGTKNGDQLYINYQLSLGSFDGKVVDKSEAGKPLNFTLGARQVIPGFDAALHAMCSGEKRSIKVSGEGGYGVKGVTPDIPSCADLYFKVELVKYVNGTAPAAAKAA